MTPEEQATLLKRVEDAANLLSEHFEAVQVLCSLTDGEGTTMFARGAGSWYARQGMAKEFMERDQARTLAQEMPRPDN